MAPGAEGTVATLGWAAAEAAVRDLRGVALRTTPARVTRRMEVPGDGAVYRKVHAWSWLDAVRATPAECEWQRLHELRALGVPVPEPVLVARCGKGSVLVTREVAGAVPLDAWLRERRPATPAAEFALLRALAGHLVPLCARLHGAGFFHRDLYLCHWLLARPEDPPVLIDLQRVGHGRAPRRRWFVKDLAALHFSAPAWVSRGRRLRFLRGYLAARGLREDWRPWFRAVAAKARRIAAHVPKYG